MVPHGAGAVDQLLRAVAALAEDSGPISSTHGGSQQSLAASGDPMPSEGADPHASITPIHRK